MLHITNGDCAVAVLREAGMQGDLLPWDDVLHEGPVADLPLDALSALRARFIAEGGWAPLEEAQRRFSQRDARLRAAGADDEVVLWFEHDLYDQLQLLQVLAWFKAHPHPRLSLICEAEYLGEMEPARAAELFTRRCDVTDAQIDAGAEAWRAFAQGKAEGLLRKDLSSLPFLRAAIERYLQEQPGADGLSRTERHALEALAAGPLEFAELFRRTQANDEPRFLGDSVFMKRLERLEAKGLVERRGTLWALR